MRWSGVQVVLNILRGVQNGILQEAFWTPSSALSTTCTTDYPVDRADFFFFGDPESVRFAQKKIQRGSPSSFDFTPPEIQKSLKTPFVSF